MLDIGQIHRTEYELNEDRSIPVSIAESPGRVHFLGDQGDPHDGFFLSAAIDCHIKVAVNMRKDNSFRFFAADLKERKRSTLVNLKYRREDRWANYLKTAIFLFIQLGCPVKGMNFTFCGNIPQQIGLASSTAIEVAAAMALKSLFRIQISDADLAQKLYDAHLSLFDVPASLADYQVCLLARKDQFLLIDINASQILKIKSPISRYKIILVDSRVPRMGIESELVSRKADALKGLQFLTQKLDGASFKDFSSTDLLEALGDFPEKIRRRTMHIVEEIHRATDACEALQRGDVANFAKLIFHSHESLRDLYEISCPEVDWLVKRAQEIENAGGARMTGLGFGGCTYSILRNDHAQEYKKRLEEYERIFGFKPVIYEAKIATGARPVQEKRG